MRRLGAALLAALAIAGCTAHATKDNANASRSVSVDVGSGPSKLPGTLRLPGGRGPFPAVVLVAGSGPHDRDETVGPNKPFRDIADGLAKQGIASVRYDKQTLVHRVAVAQRLATYTAEDEYVPDALAAIAMLERRAEVDPRRVFVLGHSQGGTLAPRIALGAPSLAGVVLLAASATPFGATLVRQTTYLAKLRGTSDSATQAQLAAVLQQATLVDDPNLPLATPASALPGGIGATYWLDLTHHDPVAIAAQLSQPLLVLQGDRDYQVTVDDDLVRWQHGLSTKPDVIFRRYPLANHLFIDGEGPPNPTEYGLPGHVGEAMIADLGQWILDQHSALTSPPP